MTGSAVHDLPYPIHDFIRHAEEEGLHTGVDAPHQDDGEWWIDMTRGDEKATVAWKVSHGFGLFHRDAEYGVRPDLILEDPKEAFSAALTAFKRPI